MFSLRLALYKYKNECLYWLMGKIHNKLNKCDSVEDMIYRDILHTFSYNEEGYYKFYMKDAPLEFLDLESIIQDLRDDYTKVNEVDLNYQYSFLLEHITSKLMWYPSVKVLIHNDNGEKYFEVYLNNYKQEK